MAFEDSDFLVRFIDEKGSQDKDVAPVPRKLEIAISDARQIFPKVKGDGQAANLLLLTAGTIRFGQDGDSDLEDDTNQSSESSEVDEGTGRTVQLMLDDLVNHPKDQPLGFPSLIASASFAALANAGLTADDFFLVAVDNAAVVIDTVLREREFVTDICLRSNVKAQGEDVDVIGGGERAQLNRSAFQATVLFQRPPGS